MTIPKGVKCISKITKIITGHVGGKSDYYDILTPEGMVIENGILKNDVIIRGPLRNPVMLSRYFSGERIIDNKGQELVDVFLSESGMLHTKKRRAGNTISTVLVGKGTTKNGTLLLKELFGDTVFDYAKPIELINYLISKHTEDEFIILDFFSGSATTAHSVFLTNLDPQKNVKFILIQIDEKIEPEKIAIPASRKIALSAVKYLDSKRLPHLVTELAKERIRRAGKKVKEEAGLQGQNLDTGFRVLKLDSSNMEDVYYTPQEFSMGSLFNENVKADRSNEDLLFQVMLDLGIELSAKIGTKQIAGKQVHIVDEGYLVACFDHDENESPIIEIAKQQPVYFVMRDASAANDNVIDNFEQIFKHYSPDTSCRII